MINHDLKTVFVHIPKTAGVSLVHALLSETLGYKTSGDIKKLPQDIKLKFSLAGPQKHKQARLYVPDDITQKQWDEYYKFAFVRNPWDRVVSEFHWRNQIVEKRNKAPKDFKTFIKHCETRLNDKTNKANNIYWTHAQTQKSYVTNNKGILILDDVFKFEEIDSAIDLISKRLNVNLDLKKYNSSKHKHYRDYYENETKEMVSRLYKEDIEMFDYEF